MQRNSLVKMADLVVTSVNPTTAPDNVVWCSDPANVIKDAPTVGLPGDISTVLCNYRENGDHMTKQYAV